MTTYSVTNKAGQVYEAAGKTYVGLSLAEAREIAWTNRGSFNDFGYVRADDGSAFGRAVPARHPIRNTAQVDWLDDDGEEN